MATKEASAKKAAKKPAKKPANKSAANKPAAKTSAAKKSAAKKPANKPAAKTSAAKKPTANKPAAKSAKKPTAASTEAASLTVDDVRQRLLPLVGEATLENPEMSLPVQVIDWAAMESDERNAFAFTHLYMFNFARGGDGERIVFDSEYLPIGELTLDDDKLAILCELATGATYVSGGHTASELHAFAPSLDALVTRLRVASN